MRNVDMSAKAVTARLKQMSQLRQLGLSLSKAKIKPREDNQSPRGKKQLTTTK